MRLFALLVLAATSASLAQQSVTPQPVPLSSTPQSSAKTAQVLVLPTPDTHDNMTVSPSQRLPALTKEELQLQEAIGVIDQKNCPVVFVRANLTPYLMLTQSEARQPGNGGLDLGFTNSSGKNIYQINFTVHVLARKSVYDLDAKDIALELSVSGNRSANSALSELRHLELPQSIHPAVISSVTLQQVFFEDGTVWMAKNSSTCSFSPNGSVEVGSRFQLK